MGMAFKRAMTESPKNSLLSGTTLLIEASTCSTAMAWLTGKRGPACLSAQTLQNGCACSGPIPPPTTVQRHQILPVVAEVPVLGNVLRADDQRIGARVQLQHLVCKVDGDGAGAAAHAAEVVTDDVGAHLEVVDHHGAQRGGGVEQAAVDHQDPNVLGSYACPTCAWCVKVKIPKV
eukprot:1137053-Pelagomonas_calceolata.AAC.4